MIKNLLYLTITTFLCSTNISNASLWEHIRPYDSAMDVILRCTAEKGEWENKCGKKLDKFLGVNDINAINDGPIGAGYTLLSIAISFNKPEALVSLLERGADPKAVNKNGKNSLQVASIFPNPTSEEFFIIMEDKILEQQSN